MEQIQKSQIRDIYALGANLGMVSRSKDKDDPLHDLVSQMTGHTGVSQLSKSDAEKVLAELMSRTRVCKKAKPKSKPVRVAAIENGMSEGQRRKVWYFMYQLAGCDSKPSTATLGERLCGIIKKEMGLDATTQDPMAWLTYPQGVQLIEMLKRYVASAEKRAKGGDRGG